MHRTRRRLAGVLAVAVTAGLTTVAVAPASQAAGAERVAGQDRYQTAALVSQQSFAPGVPAAYVVTGLTFPDGLSGGAAAAHEHGPVLLTAPGSLPGSTAAELQRLRPQHIYVLGGAPSVSDAVLQQIRSYGSTSRLSGPDRYATAAAVSAATFDPGAPVYVATGQKFPDALSAAAAAGHDDGPVLLTAQDTLPDATAQELARLHPSSITVLGGPDTISPAVEAKLASYGPVQRIAGATRYQTAVQLAQQTFDHADTVFLASGLTFADALGGGAAAAVAGGPLLLTSPDCLPADVASELHSLAPSRVVVLGGLTTLSANVEQERSCADVGGPDPASVAESPDYASEQLADPWDYSNSADIHIGTPQMANSTISGGLLSFDTATQDPWITPLPYLPGSIPLDRDGPSHPIDASRYTHVAVRMYAGQAGAGLLLWSTCDWSQSSSCNGAMSVPIQAGWHTYDWVPKTNNSGYPAAWSGHILRLQFTPNSHQGVPIKIDWMRVHGDTAPVTFTYHSAVPGQPTDVYWDADADPSNNTPDNPGWGLLAHVDAAPATGTVSFPAGVYPPGTYRVYTQSGSTLGGYTASLQVRPTPLPVIDTPSEAGGADYATTVRHDPWDFSSLGDVDHYANISDLHVASGVLEGTNGPPSEHNPYFYLKAPQVIDGNTYHRLTFKIRYDGPFGLTGGPTGGCVARFIWNIQTPSGPMEQTSDDIVIYPGWQTITIDLKTAPASAITDPTQANPRVGWAGQKIVAVRLDPNEDESARHWYVDDVRLAADSSGQGGFTLGWHDAAYAPGETATVFLDNDRHGFDGVAAGSATMHAGANSLHVAMPASLANGTYWPYLVVHSPYGTVQRYATGPVHLVH